MPLQVISIPPEAGVPNAADTAAATQIIRAYRIRRIVSSCLVFLVA